MAVRDALQGTGIGAAFGVLADIVLTGGDTLWFLVDLLIDQGPLLFLFVSRLRSVAPSVEWLPAGTLRAAYLALAALLAAVALYRLLKNLSARFNQRYDS